MSTTLVLGSEVPDEEVPALIRSLRHAAESPDPGRRESPASLGAVYATAGFGCHWYEAEFPGWPYTWELVAHLEDRMYD